MQINAESRAESKSQETHVPLCELMMTLKMMSLLGQGASSTTSYLYAKHTAGKEASRAVFRARDFDFMLHAESSRFV